MASTVVKLKNNLLHLKNTRQRQQTNKSYTYANRKNTRKQINRLRKQIGLYESIPFERNVIGSSVNESFFKYTIDEDRKRSVMLMYPFFPDLVRIPFMIDWASYTYKGPCTLLFGNYDENANTTSNKFVTANVDVSYSNSRLKKDCFYFFGGCAYEILNYAIKAERLLVDNTASVGTAGGGAAGGAGIATVHGGTDRVNMNSITEYEIPFLHDIVDPTGDVDVHVRRPFMKSEENDDPSEYDYTDGTRTTLNQWFTHWINWLFDNVVEIFKSSLTRKGILPLTEHFDLMENHEIMGVMPLRSVQIDNTVVVLLQQETMVKVQIIMKLKGVSESDHYFEMVIPLLRKHYEGGENNLDVPDFINKVDSDISFNLHTMNLPNVRIESFYSLVNGNVDSIKNRFRLAISPARHKFYNHVQRLIYLNKIFPYFVLGKDELESAAKNENLLLYLRLKIEREQKLAQIPYLIDITNTTVLSSFQTLFESLKSFDDPYGVRGLLGNNVTPMNPICLFDYQRVGESCTLDDIETLLFGNMIPVFSKMLMSTEKGVFKNLNRFTKRNSSTSVSRPVYEPMVQSHGIVRSNRKNRKNRKTRKHRRTSK